MRIALVLNTVLGALLPMVVTFVLGFIAAWHRDLDIRHLSHQR